MHAWALSNLWILTSNNLGKCIETHCLGHHVHRAPNLLFHACLIDKGSRFFEKTLHWNLHDLGRKARQLLRLSRTQPDQLFSFFKECNLLFKIWVNRLVFWACDNECINLAGI